MKDLNFIRQIIREALSERVESGKTGIQRLKQQGYLGDEENMPIESSDYYVKLKGHPLFSFSFNDLENKRSFISNKIKGKIGVSGNVYEAFKILDKKFEKIASNIKSAFSKKVNPATPDIKDFSNVSMEIKEFLKNNSSSLLNDKDIISWYRLDSI
jgi:hypothetical protein